MAKGILIAAMDFANVAADEFNDWYDTEHVPERQRVPGFLTLQRWIGAENPKQSVATYDLDRLAVLQSPGYRAIGGENLSPWSKRVTAKVERLLRYEGEQILPGDATAPASAGGLLLVGMTPGSEVETAFNVGTIPNTSRLSPASPGCYARAAIGRAPAAPNTWRSTISRRRAWSTHRNGSRRARQPRCPSMFAIRSPIGCGSFVEITCAHRLARQDRRPTAAADPCQRGY
jgi:hypothetical protein